MQANITNKIVRELETKEKPYEIRDTQLKGLLLRVQPSGVMTYYVEFKRGKRVKIGRADAITPVQARDNARAILSEVYQGEDPTQKKSLEHTQTYLQFLEKEYKAWLISNLRTGEKTFHRLKNSFSEFHEIKLNEITHWLIEKWKLRRQKDGLKASSINRELADFRACISRAVQWGHLENDPLEKVKGCRVDSNPKIRYLTDQEEKCLRKALDSRDESLRNARDSANEWRSQRSYKPCRNLQALPFADHLKPAVLLSINTGLRRGELFNLKWSNIDLNQRTVTVSAEIAKNGKTRHVPLNDEAFTIFREWKTQQDLQWDYVFCNVDGKPFHDVRSSWEKICKASGIENFRWHDLRHTFASKLVMNAVDLNTVRELLGHSDYKMTLRYAHLAPGHKAAAVAKLNAMLSENDSEKEKRINVIH